MTVLPMLLLAFLDSSAQAAERNCPNSAQGAFQIIGSLIEVRPFGSETDFQPFVDTLDAYCFRRSVATWELGDADAKVIVAADPQKGIVSISLQPHSPEHFGDAALAALISRAERVSASMGDSIELRLPPRSVSVLARSGQVTERLGFLLAGGRWYRTTVTVQWAAAGTRSR